VSPVPTLAGTPLGGRGPRLLVGPALGTSAATLWARCAAELADHFEVIGWDLPGHGGSGRRSAPPRPPCGPGARPSWPITSK